MIAKRRETEQSDSVLWKAARGFMWLESRYRIELYCDSPSLWARDHQGCLWLLQVCPMVKVGAEPPS